MDTYTWRQAQSDFSLGYFFPGRFGNSRDTPGVIAFLQYEDTVHARPMSIYIMQRQRIYPGLHPITTCAFIATTQTSFFGIIGIPRAPDYFLVPGSVLRSFRF